MGNLQEDVQQEEMFVCSLTGFFLFIQFSDLRQVLLV